MSDSPDKRHPWSKYYDERGVMRPSVSRLRRGAAVARGGGDVGAAKPPGDLPRATAEPFIASVRRELAAQEQRRTVRRRWTMRAAMAALVLVALHFAVTRIVCREPTAAALGAYADALVPGIVAGHSTSTQPLVGAGAAVQFVERVRSDQLRYTAQITLRLSEPLYAPATSNGTAAYRQLQQALATARERDLEHKLLGDRGLAAPSMPLLLDVVHRPGERIVVRVPFEAKRFGWRWTLGPAQLALGRVDRALEGAAIRHYANIPHLLYGAGGTLDEVRRLSELARDYISAVATEVQKRADVEAVAPAAGGPADGAAATVSAASLDGSTSSATVAVDPDAPAVAAPAGTIDPNAPAVEPESSAAGAAP